MKRSILPLLIILVGGLPPAGALDLADPAPPLLVSVWVRGEPIAPAAGREAKFVVVAFWATWCRPSIRAIPHLTALQERFAGRGVVVVGVTSVDPNNSVKKIRKFVEAQGEAMPYRVAIDDGDSTWKTWMQAAGRKALSTAFVVDEAGRIAWIGTPGPALDRALEEIVSGRWSADDVRRIRDLERQVEAAAGRSDWEAALAASDRLVAAGSPLGPVHRYRALEFLGRIEEAHAAARTALATPVGAPDWLGRLIDFLLAGRTDDPEVRRLAVEAFDRVLDLDPRPVVPARRKFEALLEWGEIDQARDAGVVVVGRLGDDSEGLNSFSWGLLTEDDRKGKLDTLALVAARKASALTDDRSWHILDTLALALFRNGQATEAVRFEQKAIEEARREGVGAGSIADLEKALDRFRRGKR